MDASPDDLALYMGVPASSLDDARARFLLDLAVSACEEIADPLPEQALGVVLDVASTAYVAPPGAGGQQTAGPFSATLPAGGVVLTRRQERRLRRLAGGSGGAFSIVTGQGSARPTGDYGEPLC